MKKFLLTAALVLALVTSLTAGTMAAYTQTVTAFSNTVTSKSFLITSAHDSENYFSNVKVAPGDTLKYILKVYNKSEVRADLVVSAAMKDTYKGLTYSIRKTSNGSKGNGDTTITDDDHTANTAAVVAEDGYQEYEVTVSWDYKAGVTEDAGKQTTLEVKVTGTQSDLDHVDQPMNTGTPK